MRSPPVTPIGRSLTANTQRADQRTLRVLAGKGLSEADAQSLRHTWMAERQADESLTQYLVRINVLRDDAPQLLAMNWGDELLFTGAADLFRTGGLDALWKLLQTHSTPGVDRNTPLSATAAMCSETAEPAKNHVQTPVMRKEKPPAQPIMRKDQLPAPPTQPAIPPQVVSGRRGAPAQSSAQPTDPSLMHLTNGQLLGRCLITGRIAEGSYGAVYRALHRTLNIPVAVKVLHPELLDGESKAGQQFRSEAMLLARLNHPNIVRLWDFDDSVAPPYLVLEFIEGATVADMIQRRSILRIDLALRIVSQVVDGLEAAFKLGIVHRDIKPANILITRDERAKIADLGLATVMDIGRQLGHAAGVDQSPMAGTVAYLAPEQGGKTSSFDHRSDIYSLGASFYHMITGRLPFNGKSSLEVLLKHTREKLTPPNEVIPSIDRGVSELIVKMMAKNPADRFRSYEELRDQLIDVDIALQSYMSGLTDDFRRGK
jgi:eukaryotic-like serine/threonine-protein kinase